MNFTSRRNFIKASSIAGVSALAMTEIVTSAFAEAKVSKIAIGQNNTILFQGDSITDAGRKRENQGANNPSALGSGYALIAGSELLFKYPEKNLKIYNKGVSGDKVYQLPDRWEKDCIELKPDVLSILVGVNDYWHKHNDNYKGTSEIYKNYYKALLEQTKKQLPNAKLIIGEPFGLSGISAIDHKPGIPSSRNIRKPPAKLPISLMLLLSPFNLFLTKQSNLHLVLTGRATVCIQL